MIKPLANYFFNLQPMIMTRVRQFSVKFLNKIIAIKQLLWWVRNKLNIHASSKRFTRQKSLTEFRVIMWESCIVFSNARIGIFFFFVNFHFALGNYSIRMVSYIQPVVLGFFLHNYVACIKFTSRCVLFLHYGCNHQMLNWTFA